MVKRKHQHKDSEESESDYSDERGRKRLKPNVRSLFENEAIEADESEEEDIDDDMIDDRDRKFRKDELKKRK